MPKQDRVCKASNLCFNNQRIFYNSLFRGIPEPQGIILEFKDILFRILILDCFQFRSNVVHFLSLAIYISLIGKKRLTLAQNNTWIIHRVQYGLRKHGHA